MVATMTGAKRGGLFTLKGRTPVPSTPGKAWDRWCMDIKGRRVARTITPTADIDTLFTGINNAQDGEPPLLYETVVNGGALHGRVERHVTWEEADTGHNRLVMEVVQDEERRGYR